MSKRPMKFLFKTILKAQVTHSNGSTLLTSKLKLLTFRDPEHANFEFNYFLYGTDNSEQMTHNSIILGKIRLPKLVRSAK
jgi:hypothetical protein